MFGKSKKKNDFEDEEYEDEDQYDEYEDEEDDEDDEDYDDEYDDDEYDDDEDYDDEPRGHKGAIIALVILALLLAAIAGLLFMRLRSANAQVKDLTEQLNSTRTELNTLLTEKTTAPQADTQTAPDATPEPTPEADMVDATNGPEVYTPDEPLPAEPDMVDGDATPAPATPEPAPAGTPDSKYIGINTSNTINITTNPEAKTVKAGQSATFTAAAANWKWCAWRFISPDGLHEIIFDKVNTKFAGVTTNGGNGTTFTVNNIPKEMDGWKAVCLFVDANNGMKVTEGGTITVTQ